jgi:hypothetical protein
MKEREIIQNRIDKAEKKVLLLRKKLDELKPKKDLDSFERDIDEIISDFYIMFPININNNDLHILCYRDGVFIAVAGSHRDACILRGRIRNALWDFGVGDITLNVTKNIGVLEANFKDALCNDNPELV